MSKDDSFNNFIKTIILLAKLNICIKDKFFYDKFGDKLHNFIADYIIFLSQEKGSAVQISGPANNVIRGINEILDMVDNFRYINLVAASPLFFKVQKFLLILKLDVIKNRGIQAELNTKIKTIEQEKPVYKNPSESRGSISDLQESRTLVKVSLKLNQSKKKILDFIKSYPNIRTKDIISEFNVLSDRTVKRNLTDLLRSGLIKKRIDNKAVYYYSSE